MDTKELRIGNYVNYFENSTIFEVVEVTINGLTVVTLDKSEENWIEIENFGGIPTTEEWLNKLGFEKDGDHELIFTYCKKWFFRTITVQVIGNIFDLYINEQEVGRVEYIHQLQNLYFAITQTELITK